jgi:DoxX-like family
MTLAIVSNSVALFLAFLFLLAGAAHIVGPRALRAVYRRWQFARSFRYVAGAVQLLAALFLAVPQTRLWGGALAAMILFTAVVSLLNRGRYLYAIPAILVMIALLPAIAGPI